MKFLEGKKALVLGIASNRSIAWGISDSLKKNGAELAFTYQNEKLKDRVEKLAHDCESDIIMPCDVAEDGSIKNMLNQLAGKWSEFDIIIHSLAFAPREELEGNYVDKTTKQGFISAHSISSYSLLELCKEAKSMLKGTNPSVISLSYLGAVRGMPNYNVMGVAKASLEANVRYLAYAMGEDNIRVNCISAGPIKTLAAAGISDFRKMLDHVEKNSPLRRNVTIQEVGDTASFLASDGASGITGQVLYVDSGFNIIGMPSID
ncbi:MAG: enoyl-ACP reductase [Gammaproteobacteria bacterium]|jgi:enoyl-[acyl-carrier protein] reductase I|tara:strand:+ start:761 stop:1546 length:786 start_codon:yes stop_codon:yes gene_type:complete